MSWTRFTDRLPENTDKILVYFIETKSVETVRTQNYLRLLTDGIDEHGNQKYTPFYEFQNATHWMYLPRKPK